VSQKNLNLHKITGFCNLYLLILNTSRKNMSFEIKINKTSDSRINQFDENNIQFGRMYADHMLIAHYEDGKWSNPEILPYGNLSLSPATTFIHYGQSIFEGIKAYKDASGNARIFRPYDNWKRMNKSANRMALPEVPEEIFIGGLHKLIEMDQAWIPSVPGSSLYIRPFLFATDEFIGVRPATKFTFMIITSPAAAYYNKPVSIYVQDEYIRAFPGGIGETKAAGNYGACMYPAQQIQRRGYDQILWTDGFEHKYVQEIGTMNVFFYIGDTLITPNLDTRTILAGVTRDSVIKLCKEKGIKIEERPISLDEIFGAHEAGTLHEAFGTGTAASVSSIGKLTYNDRTIELKPLEQWDLMNWVKTTLDDIRYGRKEDTHGWIFPI
jgi:branched-chain amino acid aminotransferase